MNRWLLSLLPLALVACAASSDNDSTDADEVNASRAKVSGYDFEGPKALPADKVPVEFCAQVISEEQTACERVEGSSLRANGCKALCSKPIAPKGKAAGFDFTGFKQVGTDKIVGSACPAVLTAEFAACERVEGVSTPVNGCAVVCSKPIAKRGEAAGFDLEGFKLLPASDTPPICPAVVSAVKTQCGKIGGSVVRAGCKDLCSLPL